jgi:DNA-binding beta-propeller fold protein YncE
MKKDEQLVKKSLVVLSIILIGLTTSLTIFYFLNPQIKYIYQREKSIEIDYNKVFATTLSTPTAIATDNAGNVYVLDGENDKVQKFTTNGTFVKEWNIQRTKASELVPTDIATDSAGNVYVLDGGSNRVQKFTTNGIFVKEWNIN